MIERSDIMSDLFFTLITKIIIEENKNCDMIIKKDFAKCNCTKSIHL